MAQLFFDRLVDDFGIWQHTDGETPIASHGYALDDATRGLIWCLLAKRHKQADVLFNYIAASVQGDKIYGFASDERKFWGAPASEDATAQIIWAMGQARRHGFRTAEATKLFDAAVANLGDARYLRGPAYGLLGAMYVDRELADCYADDLKRRFAATSRAWPWPEAYLTYGNGILPYALLRYGDECDDREALVLGLETLNFVDKSCRLNNFRAPVGNSGWFSQASDKPPVFSQQPIDAAYMVWAMIAAHHATGKPYWFNDATEWMAWFEGNNITGRLIYEPDSHKCFDGIDAPDRVSANSGAESNVCLLLSEWAIKHKQTF